MADSIDTYVLLSAKSWHDSLFSSLQKTINASWIRIKENDEFTYENLIKLNPKKIFIPHWSEIIPSDIYNNFNCVVFHMTDLPFGRGGSPLQNLIEKGYKETVISAIKIEAGLDTGDVYLKHPLSLEGTATDIFKRAADVIEKMIEKIIETNPIPKKQEGEVIVFKRRKPEQSNIENLETINQVYDFIRMLDCEGYPHAYLETKYFKIEFNKASYNNETINANVRIIKK
jgi:methionyl-tRNA formyltransferase